MTQMRKKSLLVIIILLSLFFIGVSDVTGDGNVVENGDTVEVDYTAKYLDTGKIFDTTNETIAKENSIYNPLQLYAPLEIIVGSADSNPRGFHNALIGMKLGQRDKNILVEAEDWVNTQSDVILDILIVSINGLHYKSSGGIGIQELFENPIVALGIIAAIGAIVLFLGYRLSLVLGKKYETIKLGRCTFCGKPAIGRCGNPKCNKNVCRVCFQNGCPSCGTNKLAPKAA